MSMTVTDQWLEAARQPQGEWTMEPPKKEGWYWWRRDREDEWQPAKTYWQWLHTDTSPRKILWAFIGQWRGSVQVTGGEWYSTPIQPPPTEAPTQEEQK